VRKKRCIFVYGNFDICTERIISCICLGISNKGHWHWMIHKIVYAACHLLPVGLLGWLLCPHRNYYVFLWLAPTILHVFKFWFFFFFVWYTVVASSFHLEVILSNSGIKFICLSLKVLSSVCKRQRRGGIDTNSFAWHFVYTEKQGSLSMSPHWSFYINISRIDEYIFVIFGV